MSYFKILPLVMILISCIGLPKNKTTPSTTPLADCPDYTGVFQCPEMPNIKYPRPAYTVYASATNKEGTYIYESHLSISPEIKSKIIADGKEHTSKDHRGITRHYRASCNKGVLINRYSASKGTAQTELWIDKKGHLKIRYDSADGKILTCKKVSS